MEILITLIFSNTKNAKWLHLILTAEFVCSLFLAQPVINVPISLNFCGVFFQYKGKKVGKPGADGPIGPPGNPGPQVRLE